MTSFFYHSAKWLQSTCLLDKKCAYIQMQFQCTECLQWLIIKRKTNKRSETMHNSLLASQKLEQAFEVCWLVTNINLQLYYTWSVYRTFL